MSEKPILFSTPMVKAILDGRKTQTRRIVKPQPLNNWDKVSPIETSAGIISWRFYQGSDPDFGGYKQSTYQVGDRLWVRETFCPVDDTEFGGEKWVDYRATPRYNASHPAGWDNAPEDPDALKWKPSIYMPKKYARIWLEVTGVRVERLNQISIEDIIAEGLTSHLREHDACVDLKQKWINLWDSINGKKYPWADNPWVWVIEFKVIAHPKEER